ncbi:MAG: ferritin-like domain-containing protein [Actinomycetota bacterium]|nr:ferritin-like domain-containing protein [Actinomycetota bacterium]
MTPLQALQATLAAEHAAVYVYGVLAAQTSRAQRPTLHADLNAAYLAHRQRRDELIAKIAEAGVTPVAAAVAYDLPNAAGTATQVTLAARTTEERAALVYGQLVQSTAGTDRRWGIAALTATALLHLVFGGSPQPFPGLAG